MRKFSTFILPLLLLVAGYVVWYDAPSDHKKMVTMVTKFQLDKEKTLAYKVHSSTQLEIFMQGASRQQKAIFDAVLNVRIVKKTDTAATALMQLSSIAFDTGIATLDKALTHLYASPFIVEIATDGTILSRDFNGTYEDYQGLSQLLDMFQCRLKNSTDYTQEEQVTDGTLTAHYRRTMQQITKEVTHFQTAASAGYTKKMLRAITHFKIDTQWLLSAKMDEKSEIYMGRTKNATSHIVASIQRSDDLIDPTLMIWQFNGSINKLKERYHKKPTQGYFKRLEMKLKKERFAHSGTTIATLLDMFDPNDLHSLEKLVDFLKLYPQKATVLYDAIKQSGDKRAAALINVLELAGTPKAQQVLTQIASSEAFQHMNQLRAIIALGGVEKPTEETIDYLWEKWQQREDMDKLDLSNTSILSLGILGSKSEQSSKIRQHLKEAYSQAMDENAKRRILLLSMQNADARYFKSEIFEALEDQNPNVKGAAVKALRGIDSDEVREHLSTLMITKEEVNVRRRVAKVLQSIPPDRQLIEQARKNLFQESDNLVRRELIRYLWKHRSQFPENITTLQRLRTIERDPENQKLLVRYGF